MTSSYRMIVILLSAITFNNSTMGLMIRIIMRMACVSNSVALCRVVLLLRTITIIMFVLPWLVDYLNHPYYEYE